MILNIQLTNNLYASVLGTAVMIAMPLYMFWLGNKRKFVSNEDLHNDYKELKGILIEIKSIIER